MSNQKISVTEKYAMLRCLIAVAHADGVMADGEIAYLNGFIGRISFSDEQKAQLAADFETPQDVGKLFAQINNPAVRAQVLYFARILAYKDGVLHPSEDDILKHLHLTITTGLDMDAIKIEARKVAQTMIAAHDIRIDHNRPQRGKHVIPYFAWLDDLLLGMGIDILR